MQPSEQTAGLYRIGAVAKLVGIPEATLRVWERRYQVVSPPKSPGGHRLYNDLDVLKVTLLKSLTQEGHAISMLSTMGMQQLQGLLNESRQAQTQQNVRPKLPAVVNLAVVGYTLASRIETQKFTLCFGQSTLKVVQVHPDLTQALRGDQAEGADVLLVQMGAVQPQVKEDLVKLRDVLKVNKLVLVYHFATDHVLQLLKSAGIIARREPVSDMDLCDIIQSVLVVEAGHTNPGNSKIAPRKYDDTVLQKISDIDSKVLCECPKHVADLIRQLNSFEQYSNDCLNNSAEDARLHAYLSAVSGSARAMFEEALERVATHEGIALS
jgi:DNA-binding transcriptional MerR regulator